MKAVALVHAETSTGAQQPIEGLGKLCHAHGALLVVDTVTSLGGVPVEVDAWEADAVYSGTQKCLSCPPGPRAAHALARARSTRCKARKTKVQSWYLDAGMVADYWAEGKRVYHHTAPISMVYALRESLRLVARGGARGALRAPPPPLRRAHGRASPRSAARRRRRRGGGSRRSTA